MKKSLRYLILATCTAGLTAWAATSVQNRPSACPMPNCTMAGCNGDLSVTAVADTNTNGIPDLLKTCPVSGDKLNGDMGAPYVFSYKGQEVKLCCSSCKKDFDKNPEKYMKLIRAADKK
jgi:YHS domain-containing protein